MKMSYLVNTENVVMSIYQ